MYNTELKTKFISEYITSVSSAERAEYLFNRSQKFEEQYMADLCAIAESDIEPVIRSIIGARAATQTMDLSVLKRYARWCLDNNIPGSCDALLKLQDIDVSKLRDSMVESPEHLQRLLDCVFSKESDGKPENLCRAYFWLAFIGLSEDECDKIESYHVDIKNRVIRYDGREFKIYDEAIPVFRHLCVANSFYYDFISREVIVARSSGSMILRGTGDSPIPNTDSIRRMASRKASGQNITLRYARIKLSGTLYRMYMEESSTGKCDAKKAVIDYYMDISDLTARRAVRKESEILEDYRRWKIAFNK